MSQAKPGGRQIVIGDVHGQYAALNQLLEAIAPGEDDRIYFLGDLVDRGPDSAAVVELVRHHDYYCLRGNHEEMMMAAFSQKGLDTSKLLFWGGCGGQETLASYTSQDLLWDHVHWLQTLPFYFDLGDLWLVHAGVDPTLTLAEQTSQEFCWIRDLFHQSHKPYFADKTIVTGHTISFTLPGVKPGEVAQGSGWIDIDTGAYHRRSGWLTALDWTNQEIWQVNTFNRGCRHDALEKFVTTIQL